MSNRELDNLFKTKLEDLERKPSANAWERIQAGKQKKKGKGVWFYAGIAAAIVLLAAFTGVLLLNNETEDTTIANLEESTKGQERAINTESPLASDKKEKEPEVPEGQKNNARPEASGTIASPSQQAGDTDNFIAHSDRNKDKKGSNNKKPLENGSSGVETYNNFNTPTKVENTSVEIQNEKPETGEEEIKILDSHATNSTTVASTNQQPEAQDKGQTITFNIEDFKTAAAVAKAEEKEEKRSPLKKVVDFAKNLKEGDAGLGELREAKNELFALNFKKENDNSK
ncbi:hypothetical protein GCM10009122_27540 [Fulvivirga kasyanovii]|uniref:Uncharacterized protein n=1 Tax=Fulvivirga kasyanovii TaxID=396812 RepID=A0ABW9RT44_9BACT|nr:hypothetical protein [Fulvivirga kasyanovii]MTI27332.1 hypothetical protein [Fulvivirga kasyanovii]